jgi:hypothetical protein
MFSIVINVVRGVMKPVRAEKKKLFCKLTEKSIRCKEWTGGELLLVRSKIRRKGEGRLRLIIVEKERRKGRCSGVARESNATRVVTMCL